MSAYRLESHFTCVQHLDERLTADAQKIGRFLGSQAQIDRGKHDRLPFSHHLDYITQDLKNFRGKHDLLAIGSG